MLNTNTNYICSRLLKISTYTWNMYRIWSEYRKTCGISHGMDTHYMGVCILCSTVAVCRLWRKAIPWVCSLSQQWYWACWPAFWDAIMQHCLVWFLASKEHVASISISSWTTSPCRCNLFPHARDTTHTGTWIHIPKDQNSETFMLHFRHKLFSNSASVLAALQSTATIHQMPFHLLRTTWDVTGNKSTKTHVWKWATAAWADVWFAK